MYRYYLYIFIYILFFPSWIEKIRQNNPGKFISNRVFTTESDIKLKNNEREKMINNVDFVISEEAVEKDLNYYSSYLLMC